MHDFDTSVIINNCKDFLNIDIWPEISASTFFLSDVIRNIMSILCPFWDVNMRWEAPPWSISPFSSNLYFINMMNYFPTTKTSWQSALSPFEISIKCVIIWWIFPVGHTREWNLSLLTQVPSGAKKSAAILMVWWWIFDIPVVSVFLKTYRPLLSDTSSCWCLVSFLCYLISWTPIDFLLDNAPVFSGFTGPPSGIYNNYACHSLLLCRIHMLVAWKPKMVSCASVFLGRCQGEFLSLMLLLLWVINVTFLIPWRPKKNLKISSCCA